MTTHRRLGVALAGMLAVGSMLAACSGGDSGGSGTGAASPSDETTALTLGAVPGLDLGLIKVAEDQGLFAKHHVSVTITPVDSGPNVVTGVVAGQYDLGSTAYAPPLLALAEGAELRAVANVGTVGEDGTNGGVLVKNDSGIASWKDLAGKKIATNAPRSLFSLTIPAAVAKDGGDPAGIEIVPLPFNQIAKAVHDGQVAAGAVLEPFLTAGLKQYPDLADLGDSIHAVLPEGSGSSVYFTSAATQEAKGAAIDGFQAAITEAVPYANQHLNEVRAAGAELAGLTAEQANAIPLSPFTDTVTAADLKDLVDLMVKFQWVQSAPDLNAFLQ